jgi:hypothetical protein
MSQTDIVFVKLDYAGPNVCHKKRILKTENWHILNEHMNVKH